MIDQNREPGEVCTRQANVAGMATANGYLYRIEGKSQNG